MSARLWVSALLLACGRSTWAHGDHEHGHHDHDHEDNIVEVDSATYSDVVLKSPYAWLVEFSSKHCQSCKEFAPRWHELTHKFPELHFAHVSIDVPEGKALAKELGALREGIPNLKLFSAVGKPPQLIFSGENVQKIAPALTAALKPLSRDAGGHALKLGSAAPKGEL